MSGESNKLDARLDGWLKDWPAPERADAAWEDDMSGRIADRLAPLSTGEGDDAWLAAPLPAEPGEGGGEPVMQQVPSEVRMSEPAPDKVKRKSLKDIAQRVSAVPSAPSTATDAAPPSGQASRVSAPPEAPARPPFVSRPSEARDSDSGILDLAAVRASQASVPDSGAAPGSTGLFEDDKAPVAAAPATPKVIPAKKSSSVIPLFGGGVVALAAIAAAFFVVMKREPAQSESASAPMPAAVASAAPGEAARPVSPAATATELSAEALAMASAQPAPPPGADDTAGGRAAGAAAEPGKAAGKEEPKGAGEKSASADTNKVPAGPAPTDLGGAMATAVGATTSQPAPDKKDEPASPPSGSIPESPSQGAIQGALGSVMGSAKGCVAGMDEPSRATVVFGSNGRVKSVSVSGPAASTGAAGCIKSALSKASVGPFQRDSYSVGVTIRP